MEGLIPFVYRAIVQYRNGKEEAVLASWFKESPSASYMRLPGDSGRFQISEGFSTSSSCSMAPPNSSAAQIIVSTGIQTPVHRLTSRRLVA